MAEAAPLVTYQSAPGRAPAVREVESPAGRQPRLLDRVREAVRARRYSRRTEKAYVVWTRHYILFHAHVLTQGPPAVRSPADHIDL